jgi:hypothetical protein
MAETRSLAEADGVADDRLMPPATALFRTLLDAADWSRLAPAVQRMHGEGRLIRASGQAEVEGAMHGPARLLRRLLTLPEPGNGQAIALTIERHADHERWIRGFARGRMSSILRPGRQQPLRERLGPVTLHFSLQRAGDAIDWQLQRVSLLGLPLPPAFCGKVLSRSGASNGRYTFEIDAQLPLLGRLIAYRGWLEIDHVA